MLWGLPWEEEEEIKIKMRPRRGFTEGDSHQCHCVEFSPNQNGTCHSPHSPHSSFRAAGARARPWPRMAARGCVSVRHRALNGKLGDPREWLHSGARVAFWLPHFVLPRLLSSWAAVQAPPATPSSRAGTRPARASCATCRATCTSVFDFAPIFYLSSAVCCRGLSTFHYLVIIHFCEQRKSGAVSARSARSVARDALPCFVFHMTCARTGGCASAMCSHHAKPYFHTVTCVP